MFKKCSFGLLLLALTIGFNGNVYSQDNMTPAEQEQMMQQTMQSMLPFMGQMMKIMMEVQFQVLADPKTADRLAEYTKNYYDALVKKGFSKDDALKIAMNMGIPSFPAMQK